MQDGARTSRLKYRGGGIGIAARARFDVVVAGHDRLEAEPSITPRAAAVARLVRLQGREVNGRPRHTQPGHRIDHGPLEDCLVLSAEEPGYGAEQNGVARPRESCATLFRRSPGSTYASHEFTRRRRVIAGGGPCGRIVCHDVSRRLLVLTLARPPSLSRNPSLPSLPPTTASGKPSAQRHALARRQVAGLRNPPQLPATANCASRRSAGGKTHVVAFCSAAAFSSDSHWLACSATVSEADQDKAPQGRASPCRTSWPCSIFPAALSRTWRTCSRSPSPEKARTWRSASIRRRRPRPAANAAPAGGGGRGGRGGARWRRSPKPSAIPPAPR